MVGAGTVVRAPHAPDARFRLLARVPLIPPADRQADERRNARGPVARHVRLLPFTAVGAQRQADDQLGRRLLGRQPSQRHRVADGVRAVDGGERVERRR